MSSSFYQTDPLQTVSSAMNTIDAGTAASRSNNVKWCRAWRDVIVRYGKEKLWEIDKACRRVIGSKADEMDKELARKCLHLIRDGYQLALRVEAIESELRNLYPASLARQRLDQELGWEDQPTDSESVKLDRSCMKVRVENQKIDQVALSAYAYIRTQFGTLEVGA